MSAATPRPSRAGQDSKPAGHDSRPCAPHQRAFSARPCSKCRKPFKPAHRFLFICNPCKGSEDFRGISQ
jgi:hypothetical protein